MEIISNRPPEEIRQRQVEYLIANPRLSHGVLGNFSFGKTGGHFLQELKGPDKSILEPFGDERLYIAAFGRNTGSTEFKARIVCTSADQSAHVFALSFNDRRGDKRPGSHTDYMTVVPESEFEQFSKIIEEDPSILIELFQKKYPRYDRSEGGLVIDPNFSKIISL